jgi:hypothetical protein
MTETWQSLSATKREANTKKIPQEWRLPSSVLEKVSPKAQISVLEIPSTSGILSAKEIELTEKYDATTLLGLLANGEVRYA